MDFFFSLRWLLDFSIVVGWRVFKRTQVGRRRPLDAGRRRVEGRKILQRRVEARAKIVRFSLRNSARFAAVVVRFIEMLCHFANDAARRSLRRLGEDEFVDQAGVSQKDSADFKDMSKS